MVYILYIVYIVYVLIISPCLGLTEHVVSEAGQWGGGRVCGDAPTRRPLERGPLGRPRLGRRGEVGPYRIWTMSLCHTILFPEF